MAIDGGKLLAVNGEGSVPGPDVLDVLAVSLGVGVELLEVVRLPVGSDIEGRNSLLAADEEHTLDNAGVVGAKDVLATEEVLARSLKTGVEATNQVVGHEGELELVVVLVLDLPERVLIGLELLPEPGHGNGAGVLVGVLALPLIEDEGGLAKGLERVLGLRGRGSLRLRGGGSSLGLLLLLGGSVLDALLGELGLVDGLEVLLVDDSVVPAADGGVGVTELLVQDSGKGTGQKGSGEDISQADALANEVSVSGEVSLKDSDILEGDLDNLIDGLLVVGREAEEGAEPASQGGEELAVGEGHPAHDGGIVLLGLTQEGGLLVLGGHYKPTRVSYGFNGRNQNKSCNQKGQQGNVIQTRGKTIRAQKLFARSGVLDFSFFVCFFFFFCSNQSLWLSTV